MTCSSKDQLVGHAPRAFEPQVELSYQKVDPSNPRPHHIGIFMRGLREKTGKSYDDYFLRPNLLRTSELKRRGYPVSEASDEDITFGGMD